VATAPIAEAVMAQGRGGPAIAKAIASEREKAVQASLAMAHTAEPPPPAPVV